MLAWIAGLLLAWVWFSRLRDAKRGMPTIADLAGPEWNRAVANAPRVSVIVPARDEEAQIEASLRSLLNLDYPNYEIIAVDDRSSDATGEIMERMAAEARSGGRAFLVGHIRELPAGWLGKTHAMWKAAQQATGEWMLFTDADVVFRPDALRRAIAYAEEARTDHLVLFPSYRLAGPGKKIMLAGFLSLFLFGHRAWKVADPKARDHMGLGPFNLIRRRAYEGLGTWQALRMEVIEDIRLGKLVKQSGFSQRCALGPGLLLWDWGEGGLGIAHNLTKNFFAVMEYRFGRASGACLLLLLLNLGPFVGVWAAPGWAKLPYAFAVACLAAIYVGMSKYAGIGWGYFVLHPVATLMLLYTMLRSMAHAAWHRGVVWRGTKYSLEELRRGMVKG